jgi:hypothetical protein
LEINREAPAAGDELPASDGSFSFPAGKNNGRLAKNFAGGTIPSTKLTTTFFLKVVLRARFFPPDRRAFFYEGQSDTRFYLFSTIRQPGSGAIIALGAGCFCSMIVAGRDRSGMTPGSGFCALMAGNYLLAWQVPL